MPIVTRLFPPLSLKETLEGLGSLTDPEFEQFFAETQTLAAFDSTSERSEALAKKIDKDPGFIRYLLSALDFLYREVSRRTKDEQTLRLMLAELLKSLELTEHQAHAKIADHLVKLLSPNQNAERRDKVGRLTKGFLPNARGFSSFVDLRPNLDVERTSIAEFIPLIQFRIRTEQEDEAEESWVFQMDERALDKLSEAVKDVQSKMEIIKRAAALLGKIK
jgi:hypothetical protein